LRLNSVPGGHEPVHFSRILPLSIRRKVVRKELVSVLAGKTVNVNYAVKSSFLLGFLESVPEVSAKLKEPNVKERKFEDVVKSAEQAAVLVLVY
jgi:hypothetical protein